MAEPFQTTALKSVPPNVPLEPAAFSAFAPDKAVWKELPGNRYTSEELRAMHEQWKDVEIIIPTEAVFDAD